MGYMTKFGTLWGSVPLTTGQVFFVAPASSTSLTYSI